MDPPWSDLSPILTCVHQPLSSPLCIEYPDALLLWGTAAQSSSEQLTEPAGAASSVQIVGNVLLM